MQVVKAGAIYFALVFGAGFVLGTIRTLWVVRRFGTRMAELMEMPIMPCLVKDEMPRLFGNAELRRLL